MTWPLSQDYNEAIQSPASNFTDPDLKRGEAACNALGIPMPYSGNFADVYQVRCPDGSRWAVKCFTREAPGLRDRYHEISRHLRQAKLPFVVDFTYLEKGIRVAGQWHPVLKMQWVDGLTLNQFVKQYLDKPATLEALLHLWGKMAKYLRAAEVGHCDLQHGNVLLVPGASANMLALKLIDYDGMWVPALAGTKSGEVGHPSYQHPQRLRDGTYSPDVDRFPVLLVATALRALKAKGKELWDKYDNGDNLLFKESDLRDPLKSYLFLDLTKTGDPVISRMMDILVKALRGSLDTVPLLEEVMPDAKEAATPAPTRRSMPGGGPPSGTGLNKSPLQVAPVAVAPVVAPPPKADKTFAFDETAPDTAASAPSRGRFKTTLTTAKAGSSGVPMKVWIGAAVAAAVFIGLIGGLAAWAMSGSSSQPKPAMPNPRIAQTNAGVLTPQAPKPEPDKVKDAAALAAEHPADQDSPTGPPSQAWLPPEQQVRVNAAIDAGLAYLKTTQTGDGTWGRGHPVGMAALPGLTLLECGVPADERHVLKAAEFVRRSVPALTGTYELSLAILFLDRLGDPQDEPRIRTLALRLMAGETQAGGWSYQCPLLSDKEERDLFTILDTTRPRSFRDLMATQPGGNEPEDLFTGRADDKSAGAHVGGVVPLSPGADETARKDAKALYDTLSDSLKKMPALQPPTREAKMPPKDESDNSNTHFAAPGLWAARRHNVPTERALALLARRFQVSQTPAGGWEYIYRPRPAGGETATMTGAGLVGLAVGHGLMADPQGLAPEAAGEDPQVEKAMKFLGECIARPPERNYYFLWLVERVGMLYDRKNMGDKEWYPLGVEYLLEMQKADGGWQKGVYFGAQPAIDTSFALLFLKRANLAKDLSDKLQVLAQVPLPPAGPAPPVPPANPPGNSIINSIGMKLVLTPPGKFLMGSPPGEQGRNADEGPQHEVEIARPFYMGAFPVTRGQFAAFVKEVGYKTEPESEGSKETWRSLPFDQTDDHPVVAVTWNDAARFCEWLSKKEGKRYELPTEAEWEYACRAGSTTVYFFGDDPKGLDDYAWYSNNSGNHTHPVGAKKPNPWGLYDMNGNVWQWCQGSKGPYQDGYFKDPNYSYDGKSRLTRGGSWNFDSRYCRSAFRGPNAPGGRGGNLGFRVVLRPSVQTP